MRATNDYGCLGFQRLSVDSAAFAQKTSIRNPSGSKTKNA